MATLQLKISVYSDNNGFDVILDNLSSNSDIAQYSRQLTKQMKDFYMLLNHDLPKLLNGYLRERLKKAQQQHIRVKDAYMKKIHQLSKLSTHGSSDLLKRALQDRAHLGNMMQELTDDLKDLRVKGQLINNLQKQHFQYYNVAECDPKTTDNKQTLQRRLISDPRCDRALCSNDTLNSNNHTSLDKLLRELYKERETNPNLHLIYADFSYCSYELHEMMVLPSSKSTSKQNVLPNNDDVINILLLGESGVGKSTFINAFVNYLTFKTLHEAENDKPAVLIPVSFMITTGDDFQERTVNFGNVDSLKNEDFDHPGQSVTQRCKSYVFDLDRKGGRKLRIIDTPGFGDTRGLEQDDRNMRHGLEYINNLTHLNAVCFLLKPNATRLNIFFRTCLTQLLELLGSNARQNVIFCFTNARSTFYTPGNTAPLLRTMLDSLSINDIPFKKENTFCFDSESFRYLVARQNRIKFSDEEKHEYEMSWTTSVNESNRLLNYIRNNLTPCRLQNQQQSTRHAQYDIDHMVRPMLEAMRNTLRNLILWKEDSANRSIELCPQAIHRPIAFCFSCKRDPFQLGNFWILPDHIHEFEDKCRTCACAPSHHIPVDYVLSYEILHNAVINDRNELNDMLKQLYFASAEFAYFLINTARSTKEDPFLTGLMWMLEEEKLVCANYQPNHQNIQLVEQLEKLIHKYKEQMNNMKSNPKHSDLKIIYKWIKNICEFPMVREQIAVVKPEEETRMQ